MTTSRGRRALPRERAGALVYAFVLALLTAAYATVAPGPVAPHPWLLAVIAVLAVIADRSEVPLPAGIAFDATIALVLLAVVVAGPAAALVVYLAPWSVDVVTRPARAFRVAAVGNVALYGWQAMAAAVVLAAAPPDAPVLVMLGWLMAAGIAQFVVGWVVGPALYGTLWLGHPLRALARTLVDMAPAATVMVLLGGLTVLLTPSLGVLALVFFALAVLVPQGFLTYAARTRPVARLDRATATRRYAHALGIQLDLSRHERRHLNRVAALGLRRPATGDPADYARATLGDASAANLDAQVATEWWNGCGGPVGLSGEMIPLAARVLAVADTWSALTAAGSPRLGHREVLELLRDAAGTRLDPHVVEAAMAVVAQERVTAAEPAPEPRLHHLRVPALLRRTLASA